MTVSIKTRVMELGREARAASRVVAASDVATRNRALLAVREAIADQATAVLAANAEDVARGRTQGLSTPLLDRLVLDQARLEGILASLEQVAALPDPVGAIDGVRTMNSGIRVGRMRVPLGVIAIVYESRPNVTIEAASLCLKSGNAAILRGGSEAISSNLALAQCLSQGLVSAGLPATTIQVVETTDRAVVDALITQDDCIDMVIPRGGKGLIERISGAATVPVLKHLDGICHVYVDAAACPEKAMVFGDRNDPDSQVSNSMQDPRAYRVLEENNTRPSVVYLEKVDANAD